MSSNRIDPIAKLKSAFVRPTFSQNNNGINSSAVASSSHLNRQPSNGASGSALYGSAKKSKHSDQRQAKDEDQVGGVGGDEPSFTVWNVQWRNFQAKKFKTWDSDGVLIVNGTKLTLRNDDGKIIGNGTLGRPIEVGQEIKVGGRDVLIDDMSTHEEYYTRFGEAIPNPSFSRANSTAPKVQLPPNVILPPPKPTFKTLPVPSPSSAAKKFTVLKPILATATASSSKGKAKEMEIESENNPPTSVVRKNSKKRDREGEAGEGGASSEREYEDNEEILPSPRPSQKRGPGSEPLDLSNRSLAVEDDAAMDVDIEDQVKSREAEARRIAKGKGKEVAVVLEGKRSFLPKLALPNKIIPAEVELQSCYYTCQWRNYSTKKQPVWDGDGVLIITGKKAILKNKDSGKDIATSSAAGATFVPGDIVQVGGKTLEIDSVLDEKEYLDGSIFLQNHTRAPITVANFYVPIIKLPPKIFMDPIFGGKTGKGKIPMPRNDPAAEGAIVMARPTPEHEARYNKKGLPVVDVVIDPILCKALRPHQAEGVKFMYECVMGMKTEGQGCILADEMGLGKTIQAVSLLYTLLKQSPYFGNGTAIERAVIVCPVTLVKNWSAEIKKWLGRDRLNVFVADDKSKISTFVHSRSFQVLIIGYERLRTVMKDLASIQPPIGLVICDEGHRLKSANAQVTKALKLFSTPRRIILSGTPIQNDLSEFHSMVDFVIPGVLDTYSVFKKVFETVILKSREPKANSADRKVGTARQEQLHRVSKNFILRRTADIIQKYLPAKFEFTVFIIPTKLQTSLYARILEGNAVRDVLSGTGAHQLSLLTILRSLSNTPGLLLNQVKANKGAEILTESVLSLFPKNADANDFSLSGKFLVIGSLLEELRRRGKEKIVVVSNFTTTLDIIGEHCKMKHYPFRRLDGNTPQGDRIQMVDEFNRGILKNNFIFLLSSKSGGTGLNIVGASRLVLIDSDWNPSTDAQAMARIHREGQTKPCFIYRFLTAGTMDEKIFQRQVTKLGLSTSLMDDESAIGAGKGDAFTNADLRSIFKLHSGVTCQTHELLGCKCHLSSNFHSDGEEDDDDELPEELGFTQASQMPENLTSERKDRKNLSLLKEWVHHDCSDESAVDEIQDDVLKEVAFIRVAEAPNEEVSILGSAAAGIPLKGGNIGFAFSKKSG